MRKNLLIGSLQRTENIVMLRKIETTMTEKITKKENGLKI